MIRALTQRARRNLHGHYWTYAGFLLSHVRPPGPVADDPVSIEVSDPDVGSVLLSARQAIHPGETCVVVLHGLGGSLDSRYVQLATQAAHRAGFSDSAHLTRTSKQLLGVRPAEMLPQVVHVLGPP